MSDSSDAPKPVLPESAQPPPVAKMESPLDEDEDESLPEALPERTIPIKNASGRKQNMYDVFCGSF